MPKDKKSQAKHAGNRESADGLWKCVQCGCAEKLTPVKRIGPSGQRDTCNACYIRWRTAKDKQSRGSARPEVNSGIITTATSIIPQDRVHIPVYHPAAVLPAFNESYPKSPVLYERMDSFPVPVTSTQPGVGLFNQDSEDKASPSQFLASPNEGFGIPTAHLFDQFTIKRPHSPGFKDLVQTGSKLKQDSRKKRGAVSK